MRLSLFGLFLIALMLAMPLLPPMENVQAAKSKLSGYGFDGVGYENIVMAEKATLVQYDPDGLLDDYGYLAAVPASVFYSPSNDKIVANPVMFTQDRMEGLSRDDKMLAQDAQQGVEYLMDDFVTISEENFDVIQTVNVDPSKASGLIDQFGVSEAEYIPINAGDPYTLAAKMAESNWEYSDKAVIAVVKEAYPFKEVSFSGNINGSTPSDPVISGTVEGSQDPGLTNPNEHEFTVEDNYKYIKAKMTWGADWNPFKEQLERGKDPDIQLYCEELGQVAASAEWNVLTGASEHIGSYIYEPGTWWYAVTYMPTQFVPDEEQQMYLDAFNEAESWEEYYELTAPLRQDTLVSGTDTLVSGTDTLVSGEDNEPGDRVDTLVSGARGRADSLMPDNTDFPPWSSTAKYKIDYSIYPGTNMEIPMETPYGCRDATFDLSWSDSSQELGLILCGPSGAEIATSIDLGASSQVINVPALGQGTYSIAVVNLGSNAQSTDFKVSYSWKQVRDEKEVDCFASASNGAVMASLMNSPLLYATTGSVPESTLDALDLLGVEDVTLINLDGAASSNVKKKLEKHRSFLQPNLKVKEVKDYQDVYTMIQDMAKSRSQMQTDVVFSCVEPHSTWGANDRDNNPGAEEAGGHFFGPAALMASVHGCPVFLLETDPGLASAQAWHNEFWRRAYRGRLPPSVGCMVLEGKEVYGFLREYGFDLEGQESIITIAEQFDIGSAWDRALVGPATSGRILGTPTDCSVWVSRSVFYPDVIFANPAVSPELDETDGMRIQGSHSTRRAGILAITKEETEEPTEMPILQSWVSYQHKFNEKASKYWGCDYTTSTGITPHWDSSGNEIDLNGNWPDISTSEMCPYYFEKVGYDQVYSTSYDPICENLNRGCVLWFEVMHGGNSGGGVLGFWNQDDFESNPWRGYEENLFTFQGATDDPDVVTMSKQIGLDVLPTNPNPLELDALERHDGIIIAIAQQQQTVYIDGFDMNEGLDNIHSIGFSAGSCLIACSYLHTALVRHGSVFQVTDPWLTSWYSAFAMEGFVRDMALGGYTTGQMFERGIKHVGIEYLVDGWWWDIYENLVYFGDPDLVVYSPKSAWEKPLHLKAGTSIDGHNVYGANDHPNAIGDRTIFEVGLIGILVVGVVGAGVFLIRRQRMKKLTNS